MGSAADDIATEDEGVHCAIDALDKLGLDCSITEEEEEEEKSL